MGQAKSRKSEIDQLKAKGKPIGIFATKFFKDGSTERIGFMLEKPTKLRDKNDLLGNIVNTSWNSQREHSAQMIAEYLVQSNSYKGFGKGYQYFLINFHESDKSFNGYPSCREIGCMKESTFFDLCQTEIESVNNQINTNTVAH